MTQSEYLPVSEVASQLNLSIRAVQHRIKVGTLAATKLGSGRTSAYMVERAEVERAKADAQTSAAS